MSKKKLFNALQSCQCVAGGTSAFLKKNINSHNSNWIGFDLKKHKLTIQNRHLEK